MGQLLSLVKGAIVRPARAGRLWAGPRGSEGPAIPVYGCAWACPEEGGGLGGWGCYMGLWAFGSWAPGIGCILILLCLRSEGGGWRAGLATRLFGTVEQESLASWAVA